MQEIEQVLAKSKTLHGLYNTAQKLKDIGVKSYIVSLVGGYEVIYKLEFGVWREGSLFDDQDFVVEKSFYPEEVQAAIRKHMQKTTYLEFLKDIATAGVASFTVDMQNAMVNYFNIDKSRSYQAPMAVFEDGWGAQNFDVNF